MFNETIMDANMSESINNKVDTSLSDLLSLIPAIDIRIENKSFVRTVFCGRNVRLKAFRQCYHLT